jgi:hypothetical protein
VESPTDVDVWCLRAASFPVVAGGAFALLYDAAKPARAAAAVWGVLTVQFALQVGSSLRERGGYG